MIFRFADCLLDADSRRLTRAGEKVPVEPQVLDLLLLLATNPDRVVSREEMVAAVWAGRIVSDSAISARISGARKAVGDDGKRQEVIRTVTRRGLQMATPVEVSQAASGHAHQETPGGPPPPIRYTRNSEGHRLAYFTVGDGPPVIRMGAPLVNVSKIWSISAERTLFGTVAARHSMAHFDPAGFGLSEGITDPIDAMRMIDDTLSVANAAGFDRFSVLAESGTSLIAVRLAAFHPGRVKKLVLVGGYVDGRSRRGNTAEHDPLRGLLEEGWDTRESGLTLAYQLSYFPEGPLEVLKEFARHETSSTPHSRVLELRDRVNNDSIAEFLPRVRCPTLIIQGRDNPVHPLSEAQKLAEGIRGAELVVLDTANHIPMPGSAVWPEYVQALLAFLAD